MSFYEYLKLLKNNVHLNAVYPLTLMIYAGSKVVEKIFGIEHIWKLNWLNATEAYCDSKLFSLVILTPLWINMIHWLMIRFFIIIRKFKFSKRFKIQANTKTKLTTAEWNDLTNTVYFNQFVVLPLSFLAVYLLVLDENHPLMNFKSIPTFSTVFIKIVMCMMMYEISFYYFHRILHHKAIYKFIHKKHHKFTAPFALVGQYQHPIEFVICDVVAPGIGIFVTQCDAATSFIFMTLVTVMSVIDHCGLHLPFFMSPEAHDYHHANYNECYGSNGFMDFLHGTSNSFIKSDRFRKHKTYWGFRISGYNKKS